ncbi:hypothetical protein [Virgibacillus doumboii]|uniref:hypothetical protein n=1 Tax=Virgibacillus doumboii TaxID=2697503 RepID=UPI0013E0D5AE|nr:hypothetical protein [Virgibacillus doumboii]
MSNQMLQTVGKVRGGFQIDGYLNVTQLSRSTEWKETLKKMDSMQVLDRNKTAAILLSKDAYIAVMDYIDALEEELDNAHISTLMSERKEMDNWSEGDDLAEKGKNSFRKRANYLQQLLDDE